MAVMKGGALGMKATRNMIVDEDIGTMTEIMIEETMTTEGVVEEMMTMTTVAGTDTEMIDLIVVTTTSDAPIDIDELLMHPLTAQNIVIKKTEFQNAIPVHDVAALDHHLPHQTHLSLRHVTAGVIGRLPLHPAVEQFYHGHLPRRLIAMFLLIATQRYSLLVSSLHLKVPDLVAETNRHYPTSMAHLAHLIHLVWRRRNLLEKRSR